MYDFVHPSRVNEAFQFLTKKQKKLSGRSMTENWQIVGKKSKIMKNILTLKASAVDQPTKDRDKKNKNPLESALLRNEQGLQQKHNPTTGRLLLKPCLLYTSPSPRDRQKSRMPSSA